jgi:hypothetical protein
VEGRIELLEADYISAPFAGLKVRELGWRATDRRFGDRGALVGRHAQ